MKEVTAGLIIKGGKLLIAQRTGNDLLRGKWEFPGGKIEKGETPRTCLSRELAEELGIKVAVGDFFYAQEFSYEQDTIYLMAFWVRWLNGELMLHVHEQAAWVNIPELVKYDFAPADQFIVDKLLNGQFNERLSQR